MNANMIRKALPEESEQLSALAIRSKAHWNYSEEFLLECAQELSYSAEQITSCDRWFYVSCFEKSIQAFYQLVKIQDDVVELEALFVDPMYVGQGLGKHLFEHAKQQAIARGFSIIEIQSDPNAKEFYLTMGCVLTGQSKSQSIPGRFLPLLSFELNKSRNS